MSQLFAVYDEFNDVQLAGNHKTLAAALKRRKKLNAALNRQGYDSIYGVRLATGNPLPPEMEEDYWIVLEIIG